MRDAGLADLTLDELIELREQGIKPEYIREMGALGFADLSLDELAELWHNGVKPEYVRELRDLGLLDNLSDLPR